MPRKAATDLTATMVARLIREADETYRDVADGRCPGLTLRTHRAGSVWFARFRNGGPQIRVRIGEARAWSLAHARSVAIDIRRHVEAGHGIPAPEWIELKRAALAAEAGDTPEVPAYMPRSAPPSTWTYGEAREAYGAWMRAEVAARTFRPATVRNYLGALGCPGMRALDGRYVSRIHAPDVAEVVAALVADGKRTQAKDVVRNVRRLWGWLAEPGQVRRSGAVAKAMDELKAPRLGDTKGRQRFPLLTEIAIMLRVAQHGVLSDEVGFAVELLIFTAQRRLSIVRARVDEFEAWPAREGWGLWYQGHRKIDRGGPTQHNPRAGSHALPLPPAVWDRVQAYVRRTGEDATAQGRPRSPWLFPQVRARRAGDGGDGHMHEDTLSHAVAAMPGCRASPHDVRRAFATHLQTELGIASNRVGMVLDHAQSDLLLVPDENVMTRRYTADEMLGLKAPTLAAWYEALRVARNAVELPDSVTLKAQLVAENLRQRGVKDLAKEAERRRKAAARAYAEGRTTRQRRRAQATEAGARNA